MRRFSLMRERRKWSEHSTPLGLFSVVMYEAEDLCKNDEERRLGELLRWLNDRGCLWHIENDIVLEPPPDTMRLHGFRDREWTDWRLALYDEETCVLLKMFFDEYEEYVPPPPPPTPEEIEAAKIAKLKAELEIKAMEAEQAEAEARQQEKERIQALDRRIEVEKEMARWKEEEAMRRALAHADYLEAQRKARGKRFFIF